MSHKITAPLKTENIFLPSPNIYPCLDTLHTLNRDAWDEEPSIQSDLNGLPCNTFSKS